MALLYRGESRWKILRHPVFWMKIAEIALAFMIIPLVVTFNAKGGVYVKNTVLSFNITVKYPFHYDNTTAVYTDEEVSPQFNFDPAISVCVQLFVGVAVVSAIASVVTMLIACAVHKNSHLASKVMISEIFVAILMAFLLIVSTSLWLYNLMQLKQEVEDETKNVIETLGSSTCAERVCVEFLPNYTVLFLSMGLAYLSFVIWLGNTVLVFHDTLNTPSDVTGSRSLIWSQELPEASPTKQISDTAT